MIQFWFLWLFIAIVVVIVALTLRKEREEMPRKDILRAVETSAGSMGLAEKTFIISCKNKKIEIIIQTQHAAKFKRATCSVLT